MDASVAQGVIDQCDAFLKTGDQNILFTTFDSRIASLDFLNETEKEKYCSLNRKALASYVIPTYRKLSKGISALKDSAKTLSVFVIFRMAKIIMLILSKTRPAVMTEWKRFLKESSHSS